jgi:hypothetical protein
LRTAAHRQYCSPIVTTSLSALALILLLFQNAPPPPACQAPEYRQFDFWIGEWIVEDAKGQRLGSSRVEKIEGGCGIQENWTDRTGLTGRSINVYQPVDKRWTQLWAAAWGSTLLLQGGYENDQMILVGDVIARDGSPEKQRTIWSRIPSGGVRQVVERSRDGGRTWTMAFDGRYRSAK